MYYRWIRVVHYNDFVGLPWRCFRVIVLWCLHGTTRLFNFHSLFVSFETAHVILFAGLG